MPDKTRTNLAAALRVICGAEINPGRVPPVRRSAGPPRPPARPAYQTLQVFAGFIGVPAAHLKASLNSRRLRSAP